MAPSSRSPSPRTKRLRRAQGEKEAGRSRETEDERHDGRGREQRNSRDGELGRDRDRDKKREGERDREIGDKRRRSGREENVERKRAGTDDGRHSRGRHERSTSPLDRSHRSSRRSPERAIASRHDEVFLRLSLPWICYQSQNIFFCFLLVHIHILLQKIIV